MTAHDCANGCELRPVSEFTVAIIKPDAFERGHVGAIIDRIEFSKFNIVQGRILQPGVAGRWVREFYGEQHAERPYFEDLVMFMSSGPCFAMFLQHEKMDAVSTWRLLMGSFSPGRRAAGTIRGDLMRAEDPLYRNLVHGSDSIHSFIHESQVLRNELYA